MKCIIIQISDQSRPKHRRPNRTKRYQKPININFQEFDSIGMSKSETTTIFGKYVYMIFGRRKGKKDSDILYVSTNEAKAERIYKSIEDLYNEYKNR